MIFFMIYFQFFRNKNNNKELFVKTEKETYYFSLNQTKKIEIKGELGLSVILIDKGKFRFIDSACKNKICVHTGWVSVENFPVICLPNKISAYIINKSEDTEIDGIVR